MPLASSMRASASRHCPPADTPALAAATPTAPAATDGAGTAAATTSATTAAAARRPAGVVRNERIRRSSPGTTTRPAHRAQRRAAQTVVQGRRPVTRGRQPGRDPGLRRQHRPGRARRRADEAVRGRRVHPGGIGPGQREGLAGEVVPRRDAGVGVVQRAVVEPGLPQLDQGRGEVAHPGGRAELVGHDVDGVALAFQTQHRVDEVRPRAAVDPGRAHDGATVGQLLARGLLAGELGPPVGGLRAGGIVGLVRPAGPAGEHVVGRDVDQACRSPVPARRPGWPGRRR